MLFIEVVAKIVNLMLILESPKLDLYILSYGPFYSRDCHSLGCFIIYVQNSGLVFSWEMERIWTHVLHKSCICIFELDVRFLNHPNGTSIAQFMVHLIPGTTTT